jgi:hypothetical protein
MKSFIRNYWFPALIAMTAIAVFHTALGTASASAQSYEEETTTTTESTTTTTAVTSTTTTVAPTTTTIPTTTTVPPPETPDYDAIASADAFCADDGNVIVSVTFRGQALDDGGSLLILLDNVEMAELIYAPGEMVLENGEIRLNEPTTNGGTVTFVAHTSFGDFKFTAYWPAVPFCPQTSSTSIVRAPDVPTTPTYTSIQRVKTGTPQSFTG